MDAHKLIPYKENTLALLPIKKTPLTAACR